MQFLTMMDEGRLSFTNDAGNLLNFDTFLTVPTLLMPGKVVLHSLFHFPPKNTVVGVSRDGQKFSPSPLGRMAPIGLSHWLCMVTWEQKMLSLCQGLFFYLLELKLHFLQSLRYPVLI